MLENRLSNELSNVKNTGDINRTQISYLQIEMGEHVSWLFFRVSGTNDHSFFLNIGEKDKELARLSEAQLRGNVRV